jgi:hypothetical protein
VSALYTTRTAAEALAHAYSLSAKVRAYVAKHAEHITLEGFIGALSVSDGVYAPRVAYSWCPPIWVQS